MPIQKQSAVIILISLFAFIGQVLAQKKSPEIVAIIDGDNVYKLLEPDGIPAIREPMFLTGVEAQKQMSANEPVMGIILNGEKRAYSLWQLDHHEIVNDYIGDTPIAVTW